MSIETAAGPAPGYPLRYDVEYPERLSRLLNLPLIVKPILAIPHYLIVYALALVAGIMGLIAFFAILFTRRYPRGLFDFVVNVNRWSANVGAYGSWFRDEYPPWEPGKYPVTYEVDYPERLNRWLPLIKWLLAIPHYIVLALLSLVAVVISLIVWFAVLFSGRYPRGLYDFMVGITRWNLRVSAYTSLLRDEYPPFSLR